MNKDIFSGIEYLGFDNATEINIFNDKKPEPETKVDSEKIKLHNLLVSSLYEKDVRCPVCNCIIKTKVVKSSATRILSKDSDFFLRYGDINPYFYDVWLCNICGYAATKTDFEKIRDSDAEIIQKNISIKWHGKVYPEYFDVYTAIERYKLSLLNYCIINAKSSKKAMNCLKIAWMYRLINDNENEQIFLNEAVEGFTKAYSSENFPIYSMDKFTVLYLIGDLSRRCGKADDASSYFSRVIVDPTCPQKIKELAKDQRELMKMDAKKLKKIL